MKRKGRQSRGAAMLKEHLAQSKATQQRVIQYLESETSTNNQSNKFSIEAVASVINHLIEAKRIVKGSTLWLFQDKISSVSVQNEPPTNMKEAFNRSHSSLRSHIERSFGILKKRWKILGAMPQFSVKTQIEVIMAAFALHNYIRNSDEEDMIFTTIEQHPNYIPPDELQDVRGHETNAEIVSQGTSNEMKRIRDDIATSIWNTRRQ